MNFSAALVINDFSSFVIVERSIPIVLTFRGVAGTPPHTIPSGDSPLKKLPAPIIQYLPMIDFWCTDAFIPI
tara:strand:+ start:1413 stop:1628 length:216 start_codon:yes stop_codon:yes gene_type:complete